MQGVPLHGLTMLRPAVGRLQDFPGRAGDDLFIPGQDLRVRQRPREGLPVGDDPALFLRGGFACPLLLPRVVRGQLIAAL